MGNDVLIKPPPGIRTKGQPPSWIKYIGTDTVKCITALKAEFYALEVEK
jgi:hypothetical protein